MAIFPTLGSRGAICWKQRGQKIGARNITKTVRFGSCQALYREGYQKELWILSQRVPAVAYKVEARKIFFTWSTEIAFFHPSGWLGGEVC